MRAHEHELDESKSLRPEASRPDSRDDAALFAAAAAGRPDVLGPQGMLRVQRAVGNAGSVALAEEQSPVLDVISGAGAPLDGPVQQDMESRIGADFSDVRVHTDGAAHSSAQSVGAQAYTVGSNIVFQRDKYDPSSDTGKTMLAHELTHVVQQRNGPVDGTPTGNGVSVSDPSDRFEREAVANAERVTSGPAPTEASSAAQRDADPGSPAVQREVAPEDELEPEDGQTVGASSPQHDEADAEPEELT